MAKSYVSRITIKMHDIDTVPLEDINALGGFEAAREYVIAGIETMLDEHDVYDYFHVDISVELEGAE